MAEETQEQETPEGSATTAEDDGDERETAQAEGQEEPEAAGDGGAEMGASESEGGEGEGEHGSRLKRAAFGAAAGAAIGGAVAAAADALSNRGGSEGIKEGAAHAGEKVKGMGQAVKERLPGGASEGDAGGEEDEPEQTPAA